MSLADGTGWPPGWLCSHATTRWPVRRVSITSRARSAGSTRYAPRPGAPFARSANRLDLPSHTKAPHVSRGAAARTASKIARRAAEDTVSGPQRRPSGASMRLL
jgi:hypothetical protein